ncbi:MAG: ankyrin repeat domain-containing protein, partial [Gammaproteobacteria bacterium]|nr:ankyrin repeat domain-containing protein [Gammaproteobacteria bacterium]
EHVAVVRDLLASGADVNAKNSHGITALMFAARVEHVAVVRDLLASGADVNAKDSHGSTALMHAASAEHVEVVRLLIEKGANVNAQTAHGWTALMYAAMFGHVDFTEVIRELLEQSADVNLQNKDGRKAIDYAHGKKKEMILLNAQADKVSSVPKISSSQFASSPASASKADSGSSALASAGGRVARASGGAGQTVAKTLCEKVAAKILKDAEVQTDEPVQITLSGSQKRFAPSKRSAFTTQKPKTTAVPTGDASATTAEQPSFEIMRPIARRQQVCDLPSMQQAMTWSQPIFGLAGTQPAMAQPVAAQMLLQNLIAQAFSNRTGLFGLIELLASCNHITPINAHEAEYLLQTLGFDATVFAQQSYAPITGSQLAQLLDENIDLLFNHSDEKVDLTPQQESIIELLFAKVVSSYFS